jgi:hypothetical protein
MNYNLFLDDWRLPQTVVQYSNKPLTVRKAMWENEWVIARNFDQFVKFIEERGLPDKISFDHDLGKSYHFLPDNRKIVPANEVKIDYSKYEGDERTGYHCARWLVDYCMDNKKPLPEYYIHSDNTVGSENIRSYLENFKKHYQ